MSYLKATEKKPTNDLVHWKHEIAQAEREFRSYWDRARKITKRYRDDDRGIGNDTAPSRYNVLWSNTQTIGPTLYSRTPKVQVDRRFKDSDPVGRVASHILERATEYSLQSYDFDAVMKATRDDYLLAGRGTAWVRYEPSLEGDKISYQQVACDHVHWRDFLHAPSKQWSHVPWVGRCIYLSRKQLVERFGSDLGNSIDLDYSGSEQDDELNQVRKNEKYRQAKIYEIWDSEEMEVVWVSKSYSADILGRESDPLGLKLFYPTPRPWYATTTTDTLIPVPDYAEYQDQARELDDITQRICLLVDALRVVGVYDVSVPALGNLLTGTRSNEMVPVQNWGALAASGGLRGSMEFMSIKEIADALTVLYMARDRIKADLYEITGISDVIRGNSSPVETATAQQIKGQFATLRLADRQRDAQRYARDLIALKAEIISEHFEVDTLAQIAGVPMSNPDVQMLFFQAVELLRNDALRSFRIDIETDSMVAIDEALDKQKRTEFVQTLGGFLEGAVKASQAMPILTPMMAEALLFLVRGYPAGRSLEASIEQAMGGLQQMAQQAMSTPKQDPEMMKVQAQMQMEQAKQQAQLAEKKAEIGLRQQEAQINFQINAAKAKQEIDIKKANLVLDAQKAANEIELQREKMRGDHFLTAYKAEADIKTKAAELASYDEVETKKALIKAGATPEHFDSKGKFKRQRVIKHGEFYNDPKTGARRIKVIEEPIEEEAA